MYQCGTYKACLFSRLYSESIGRLPGDFRRRNRAHAGLDSHDGERDHVLVPPSSVTPSMVGVDSHMVRGRHEVEMVRFLDSDILKPSSARYTGRSRSIKR